MERFAQPELALAWLTQSLRRTAGRLWIPGATAEPLILADAFRDDPERARGLTFVGVWVPGINRTDWAALQAAAKAETTFHSPDWRAGEAAGLSVRPLAYSQAWRWAASTPLDGAMVHVSPPDARGQCSLGVCADFGPLIASRPGLRKLGLINPAMPRVRNGPTVSLEAFDAVLEAESPLLAAGEEAPDPTSLAIARRVAELIPDGATVQTGIGRIGMAALSALTAHRGLRLHSGLLGEAALALMRSDAIADDRTAVTTGVALGSPALYAALSADPRVRFAPVPQTHGFAALAAIPRFCAINSAVEVDLSGQADAETVGGRAVSGVGGLGDFLRGAQASEGGLPIVAMPATARGGAVSRIVSRLSSGVVSAGRTEVGVVVTEHGAADLRALDEDARAAALIAIAAPGHRESLARGWRDRRRA